MADSETATPVAAVPAAPEAAAPATQVPAAPGKFDELVNRWFAECVQGTPAGRYTDAYNAIYAATDELKRRLAKET